jgi:hypothetical protein
MRRMKLTKQAVDALRSDGNELRIWDTSISGFGVRCRGAGGKYHFLKYRLPNGRQRWATIGRHGSPWTVETARKEALRLLEQIAEGEDPVEVKTTQRADRRGEIIGLRWQWVDFEPRCIRFPDSKTGAKTVPLGDPAIDLLRGIPAVEGSEFVFPASRGSGHIVGLRSVWTKVRQIADLGGLRIHDLRHSFASVVIP